MDRADRKREEAVSLFTHRSYPLHLEPAKQGRTLDDLRRQSPGEDRPPPAGAGGSQEAAQCFPQTFAI